MDCVRKYIGQGYSLRDAVELATEECIEKGILEDILLKHRAEVIDMFLTTFDKKMYEDAIRDEGWEAGRNEGWELGRNEGRKIFVIYQENQARCLKGKGISFEDAREILIGFDEERLAEIYEEKLP